ncbi:MAG TPA: hypothetical protein DIU37_00345 [Opitutae bacterium]|nr:hypothetical protein [Opitutae bacterium]|tara:strand:- start:462 stop:1391 length:930 start_codon:yes stop_codon:yes gene_type:complete
MSCFISSIWAIEIEDVQAARNEMGTLRQTVAKAGLMRRFQYPLEDSTGYTRAADLASSVRVLLDAWTRYYYHPVQRNAIFRSVYDQVVFLMDQVGLDAVDLGENGYDGLLWQLDARLTAATTTIYENLLPAVRDYAAAVQASNEMAGSEAVLLNAVTQLRDAFFMLNDDEASEDEEESDEEESDEDSENDSKDEDSEEDSEEGEDDTSSSEYTTDTDSYTSTESESEESSEEDDEEKSSDSEYQTANEGDDLSNTSSVIYYSSTDEEEDLATYDDNNSTQPPLRRVHSAERFRVLGDWGIVLTSGYRSE